MHDARRHGSTPWTLADRLVSALVSLGVEAIFGLPGGAIEPFYNAVARATRQGRLRNIEARHETGAVFMADGYARETGRLGVVCATSGPGTTNLVTGLATAQADQVPLLAISAQVALPKFGRLALQDSSCAALDSVAMLSHCTRYSSLVSHPAQLDAKLVAALFRAHDEVAGPVHLSIPADVLAMPVPELPALSLPLRLRQPTVAPASAIAELVSRILSARRVLVYAGDGIGAAREAVFAFAERCDALIISDVLGKRWIPAGHPRYCGVFGFAGHSSARAALNEPEVDLVLAVGAALGELATSNWDDSLLSGKLVHVDDCPEHFARSPMAVLQVAGNLAALFEELNARLDALRPQGPRYPRERLPGLRRDPVAEGDERGIKPQRFMNWLSGAQPEALRLLCDAGNTWCWATHYLQRGAGDGRVRMAYGFGTMGWAIGSGVGTAAARVPTCVVTGDGAYLMSAQEISVAVQHQLPLIVFVLNDRAYGMVRHGQRLGGAEAIAHELPPVDFAALARAQGARGIRISREHELTALDLTALLAEPGPVLVDVVIDPEEVPPMGVRVRGLKRFTPGR